MPNLTIHLDEETHRLAKMHAAATGESISAMFRDHVRRLAAAQPLAGSALGTLRRYSAMEIPAREAMAALGLNCVEELYAQTTRAGLPLPRMSREAAQAMAARFLRG